MRVCECATLECHAARRACMMDHMRVAVAVAGQLRTISYVLHSLLHNVLRPLRADLFMDVSPVDTVRGAHKERDATAQAIMAINGTLRPLHLLVDAGNASWSREKSTFYGLFLRWGRLLVVIQQQEARSGAQYDWIVRTRPDIVYTCALTVQVLRQATRGRSVLKWDFVALLTRRDATVALGLRNRSQLSCICSRRVDYCVDEAFLRLRRPFLKAGMNNPDGPGFPFRSSYTIRGRPHKFVGYLQSPNARGPVLTGPKAARNDTRGPWLPQCNFTTLITVDGPEYLSGSQEREHRGMLCLQGVLQGTSGSGGTETSSQKRGDAQRSARLTHQPAVQHLAFQPAPWPLPPTELLVLGAVGVGMIVGTLIVAHGVGHHSPHAIQRSAYTCSRR